MSRTPSRKPHQVGEERSLRVDGNPVHLSQARFLRAIITTIKTIPRRIYQKGRNAQRALISLHDEPRERKEREEPRATAQKLPDDVLLEIFDCHRLASIRSGPWKWHRLAQVCRRWRFVVFAYPRRLDLRIVSTYNKPIRETPDFWPALPIILWYQALAQHQSLSAEDEDNISDILKNPARICEMQIDFTCSLLKKCASSLEKSFPALEDLRLRPQNRLGSHILDTIVLSDNFLSSSTPQLRVVHLQCIVTPMLPRLLSSSKNLVSLRVSEIARNGYFTAKDLAIGLSAATQLKSLELDFSPFLHTNSSRRQGDPPALSTRIILPSLTKFQYWGESIYLRDFVSRIDAPIIEEIWVHFFRDSQYDTHELCGFFGRGEVLRSSRRRTMNFYFSGAAIFFEHHFASSPSFPGTFRLQLPYCYQLDQHVFFVNKFCVGFKSWDILPKVTQLDIEGFRFADPADWLALLRPLTDVRRLKVVGRLMSSLVSALAQVTGETIREILPALQDLHFGPGTTASTPASIEPFITARRLYDLPISVHYWRDDCSSE